MAHGSLVFYIYINISYLDTFHEVNINSGVMIIFGNAIEQFHCFYFHNVNKNKYL